jgi:hypothetical protein
MSNVAFETLLDAVRQTYLATPQLIGFAPFPKDIAPQPLLEFHTNPLKLFLAETKLYCPTSSLRDAIVGAAPHAHWRETYKETNIGQDFMERFGCYAIIGNDAPFSSQTLWAWMVYMPAGLHYPWHQHPAEEMYFVVAGEAKFMRDGMATKILGPGDTSFHASNQPHAMETGDLPVLCLVVWRDQFETGPSLTPQGLAKTR